jgi:L-threonylcarbamoyladenylate synthase
MITKILSANLPEAIRAAYLVLQSGGLVAFPTDTIYGLAALAFNGKAVGSIYEVKNRPNEKAIPVLLGDAEELDKVALNVSTIAIKLADRFWPGPLTLVVPKNPSLPDAVSSMATVGVRVPDNPVARTLLRSAGPLAVTSANISGGKNPTSAEEVFAQLSGRIELILDGGRTAGETASTVVDCTQSEPVILREGPITLSDIRSILI